MKISGFKPIELAAYLRKVQNKPQGPPTQNQAAGRESVELSSQAKDMQRAVRIAETAPEIRPEKVEPLKKAVQEGKYQVSGRQVAEKMLRQLLLDELI